MDILSYILAKKRLEEHKVDAAAHSDIRTQINHLVPLVGLGGIVESGTNVNGNYIKFADGTMICTRVIEVNAVAMTTPVGAVFRSAENIQWLFPVLFAVSPICSITSRINTVDFLWVNDTTGLTQCNFRPGAFVSKTSDVKIACMAIGRWKA